MSSSYWKCPKCKKIFEKTPDYYSLKYKISAEPSSAPHTKNCPSCNGEINTFALIGGQYDVLDPRLNTSKCFVATAVYGDHNDPHVILLRSWRDSHLNVSYTGRVIIRIYNIIGPILSKIVTYGIIPKNLLRCLLNIFIEKIIK